LVLQVNIAGSGLLICLLSSLSHYYITGSYPAWYVFLVDFAESIENQSSWWW
jgi:hypothetical protein